MAELHEALKYLGPVEWSTVPTEEEGLQAYLSNLFEKSQLILDSVPIPSPEDAPLPPHSQPKGHASKASEVTLSRERSAQPPFGHERFQKEWGKPMKMKAQENPLGLSVYKMSGKDGKGSWFARKSVHEGISFTKFKNSLQFEFEKSLAEPGPPGTGNVRGIGGEERVEQIKTDHGNVEVYRLSAQFPGPTAARDFVTMLVTSDNAMRTENDSKDKLIPRHYMIISRPCDHPKTQPRSGFVRGNYESVEFIREVPRKLKTSQSSIELNTQTQAEDMHRQRSVTVSDPIFEPSGVKPHSPDSEDNPVEWVMITRSDPGGGIPRFLVDRGTPSSICADAVKFLDWACQFEKNVETEAGQLDEKSPTPHRRESYQSWRGRSLVGLAEEGEDKEEFPDLAGTSQPLASNEQLAEQNQHYGLLGAVTSAAASLRPYTPEVILNHLPIASSESAQSSLLDKSQDSSSTLSPGPVNDDQKSILSTTSFASAEDHWSSETDDAEKQSLGSGTSIGASESKDSGQHEKELRRLDEKKTMLQKRFVETQAKYDELRTKQAEADAQQTQKAIDKHERELKKHEERFQKEINKIEKKQERERQKAIERAKKQADKDENHKLKRERDEARQELALLKKENESLRRIVQDLQKENTSLVMKFGRIGTGLEDDGGRSRGNSISRRDKKDKDLAIVSATASMKSDQSTKS